MSECKTVTLRTRPLKKGMLSFYLDYYPGYRDQETMKTIRHEGLNIYIYANPKNQRERDFNAAMSEKAEAIRCRRFEAIVNERYDFFDKHKYEADFLEYYRKQLRKRMIKTNVNDFLDKIKTEDVVKDYLSVEELYRLAETPCKIPVLKTASLFSCLTSLRLSDVLSLCWEEIVDFAAGGKCVHTVTQKTKTEDIIPISDEALKLIGYSPEKTGLVFKGLKRCWTQHPMKEWIRSAGITKNITFHSYRRTFATLQAAAGTDIRTIQSMMVRGTKQNVNWVEFSWMTERIEK